MLCGGDSHVPLRRSSGVPNHPCRVVQPVDVPQDARRGAPEGVAKTRRTKLLVAAEAKGLDVGLSHRKAGRALTKCLWVFMILLLLLVNRISGGKWRQDAPRTQGGERGGVGLAIGLLVNLKFTARETVK